MAGSKISFSYEGIGEMLRSDFMEAYMRERAERIKTLAESRAPVYDGAGSDPHRGRYKASFRVESTDHGGTKGNRAAGVVINDDPTAIFVEKGTRAHGSIPAQPGQHILAGAMMAAAGDE